MRVLFWSSGFLPQIGGIGVLAARFLPAMRKRGYEYVVVTSQGDGSLPRYSTFEGISVYRFPFWQSLADVDALAKAKQQITKLKLQFAPDLIHLNGVGRDDFFYHVTVGARPTPLLVTLHGEWVPHANALVKTTLESANWVTGCSKAILSKGRGLAPTIMSRSSVIYNAVDQSPLRPKSISTGSQRVLCLGRLSKEKGFDLAVIAFTAIVKEYPNARLIVAGDGSERTALETQALEAGISDAVDFVGWVAPEDVPALINTVSVLVVPSRCESLPVAALQAAHMSCPVVGTRVGGLPEVIDDQQTGLLVEKEQPRALANAIRFLFEHPETAMKMGLNARKRVLKDFGWEEHVNAYDRLYKKLIMSDAIAENI